jgi:hypothetical protein
MRTEKKRERGRDRHVSMLVFFDGAPTKQNQTGGMSHSLVLLRRCLFETLKEVQLVDVASLQTVHVR